MPKMNNLYLILKKSTNKFDLVCERINELREGNKKICYVCLSKPYSAVIESLQEERRDCDRMVFVDAISSPEFPLAAVNNCFFTTGLSNLKALDHAIKQAVRKKDCGTIIFDAITALLVYQPTDEIVRFTHELLNDEARKNTQKVFIGVKEEGLYMKESTKLIKDLNLFADRVIELK